MILQSIATAVPSARYTQRECFSELAESPVFAELKPRSRALLERVLCGGESGIAARHFAAPSIAPIIASSSQDLNETFEREAPRLAACALEKAMDRAEIPVEELDALFVCTCTGYLCPGVSSHVAERLGMRGDAVLNDMVGLGCGAAIPTMRSAAAFLALHPGTKVATVAVEVCSAAFYVDDDPGVLVSLCLFGDGAAAVVWGDHAAPGDWQGGHFKTVHLPRQREKIRFVSAGGKLKNKLDKCVPVVAAEAVQGLFEKRFGEPDQIVSHAGGRDVVDTLEKVLERNLPESREVLRQYGNMSSPSVLFALEKALANAGSDASRRLWLTTFGAGFAAHACEIWRTP